MEMTSEQKRIRKIADGARMSNVLIEFRNHSNVVFLDLKNIVYNIKNAFLEIKIFKRKSIPKLGFYISIFSKKKKIACTSIHFRNSWQVLNVIRGDKIALSSTTDKRYVVQ